MIKQRVTIGTSGFLIIFFNFTMPSEIAASEGNEVIELSGRSLTVDEVYRVAKNRTLVRVTEDAHKKVHLSHKLLIMAASQGHEIYGLNRGVGLNKDQKIFRDDRLTPGALKASQEFNIKLLRSHQVSIGPIVDEEIVRAAMLARLNTMLIGTSGTHPKIVQMYVEFLNRRIHPLLYSCGSVGEADIAILPNIGLAFLGEGEVRYKGKRVDAKQALRQENIDPVVPFAKDALSILSSNAYAAGYGTIALRRLEQTLESHLTVFALSLEAFNGNVAPFLQEVQQIRPFKFQNQIAEEVRNSLQGSYLWTNSESRALQDPLSFRDATQVIGTCREALANVRKSLEIQLNCSEDNPAVIIGIQPNQTTPRSTLKYYVNDKKLSGMVVPTANFEPINWVLKFEALSNAVGHVASLSCQRIFRFGNPSLSGLPRYLRLNETDHGIATIEKTCSALRSRALHLQKPVSLNYLATAGGIEDAGTNSVFVISRVEQLADVLDNFNSLELFVAALAIDIRKHSAGEKGIALGIETHKLYDAFRKQVTNYDGSKAISLDLIKAKTFVGNLPKLRRNWR